MNNDIISRLMKVINALEMTEIRGRQNMQNILGCIGVLESVINDIGSDSATKKEDTN